MSDVTTLVPSFYRQLVEGRVDRIVLQESEDVSNEVVTETVIHMLSRRDGLLRRTNPCTIRKRRWRSEGDNARNERLQKNERNA